MFEQVRDLEEADDIARRTTALFEEPFQVEGKPLCVGRWRCAGAGQLWVAANLSPRQLAFGTPTARCERLLGEHHVSADALRLELATWCGPSPGRRRRWGTCGPRRAVPRSWRTYPSGRARAIP